MSDSEDSTSTYTKAPPSPDYVPGLEEPEQAPPSPVYVPYVPDLVYPEFMPLEDEVLPAEEQPLPTAVSPTADSPGYVPELDPKEDPEEDDDEDPEEDPADYPADGGDDGGGGAPAPTDSTAVALPAVDHAPSAEETEPFKIDESAATPPPHHAYRIPSPPLLVSPPLPLAPPPLPVSPTYPLGYRVAMVWLRAEAPSTSHSPPLHIILSHTRADTPPSGTPPLLPIPAPKSSPSLLLPSPDHRADRPEVCLPPRKRLCFAFGPREIMRDLERDVSYGITDTWEEMLVDMEEAPSTDDTKLGRRMTEFATRFRQETCEIYVRLDDEQTERQLMAGRLNMLYRDRRAYARTALLMEREARMSREAWGRSMDASDLACSEVMSLRTTVLGQQAVIIELLAADRRRQLQFIEALKLLKRLQTQMTEFESQQGPAKGPAQPDAPEEAAPKRATRSNTAPKTTNTTSVNNAQLQAMIDQGVTAALAARDADINTNGGDSHNSGTGVRRTEQTAHECTYTDFLKCQSLNFKGMEGVAGLS
ncbi:hypothetical protein Tco_0013294 [Tanacetum coccineum]